jgi:hypothetical protein
MASTINAKLGGAGGIEYKGDATGALNIQTNGTTAVSVTSSQIVSFANPPSLSTIKSTSTTAPTTFQNSAGTEIGTLCRAWVNFGYVSSAITVRASFNVSGVTRASAGTYTVNFTNSLPDANYSVCFGNVGAGSTNLTVTTVLQGSYITGATAKTAASVGIYTGSSSSASSTPIDVADVSVNIFR